VLKQRDRVELELGDPREIRAEHDGLQHALTQLTRQYREIRNELVEREVQTPSEWVMRTIGERPTEPRTRKQWEQAARQIAHYRHQYDITDPDTTLGAAPDDREQQRDWQRTLVAISHTTRHLDVDVDINPFVEINT
jgi:hypothetical protein